MNPFLTIIDWTDMRTQLGLPENYTKEQVEQYFKDEMKKNEEKTNHKDTTPN